MRARLPVELGSFFLLLLSSSSEAIASKGNRISSGDVYAFARSRVTRARARTASERERKKEEERRRERYLRGRRLSMIYENKSMKMCSLRAAPFVAWCARRKKNPKEERDDNDTEAKERRN